MFITRIDGDDHGGLIRLTTTCGREIEGGGTLLDMDDDNAIRLADILTRSVKWALRRGMRFFFLTLRGITPENKPWSLPVDEARSLIRQIQECLGNVYETAVCWHTMSA